jgi:hypothetical protein
MKLAVSYDTDGTILTMFDPDKLRGENLTLQYVPAKGEKHEILDVPKDLEGKAFTELPKVARVNTKGGAARLERQ